MGATADVVSTTFHQSWRLNRRRALFVPLSDPVGLRPSTCPSRGVRLVFTVRRIIARPGWSSVMYWLRRGRQLAERKEPLWRAGHPPHSRTRFFCNEQSDKKAKPNTNKPTPFYSSAFCFLCPALTSERIYGWFLVYVSIYDLFKSF